MISMITTLAAGNALRVFLVPPSGGMRYWRVLRKDADTFTGPDDAGAVLVYEGDERCVLDWRTVLNGQLYYYRAYYWDGSTWTASVSASGTPSALYADASTDVPSVVLDRLAAGLQVEVARGSLRPQSGGIKVLNAPPVFEDTRWPMVTVHLQSEAASVRGLGEDIGQDSFSADDDQWQSSEGWLSRVTLAIVGWTQNPDERAELRRVLRRLIIANLPVFEAEGMVNVDLQVQDIDAVSGEYPAPVYQVMCTFSCLAPAIVKSPGGSIAEVQSTFVEG